MNTSDINSLLKENWYVQQFIGTPLLTVDVSVSAFVMKKDLGFGYTSILFTYEKKNLMAMHYLKSDLKRIAKILQNNLAKDKEYFSKIKKMHDEKFNAAFQKLLELKKNNPKEYSEEELFNILNQVFETMVQAVGIGHVIESYSTTNDHVLKDKLQKKIKDLKELNRALNILTTPLQKSFVNLQEEELAEILKIKNKQKREASLNGHLKKYNWIKNSYAGAFLLTLNELLKEKKSLKNIDKDKFKKILKEKEEIIKKYNLDKDTINLCNNLNFMTIWQDERKVKTLKTIGEFEILLKELERRYNIPINLLKHLTNEEIINKKFMDKEFISKLKEREKLSIILISHNLKNYIKIYEGEKAKALFSKLKQSSTDTKVDTINGTCASTGQAVGAVSICRTLDDINNFTKGKVLVASMTRPEYMPAMKKAIAIVTDEGGITCHAAIVSRELGIPCVIGTKIATKVFKDNDLVEVKANHGEIRIIERAKFIKKTK